ncbi:hypothetical protein GYMLUDRAFT_61078 [Collybiopsis luxurians FD-317 M1]|uniref:receptor protein-tyrosine kinase n=1 Tax=Collybiopsis luxurians FD-317 M1 TaxID=944289 RepID=A0A0D0CHE5_9AGAR|nr:hypothetical protein GYMLUDRAFT_61078 [Collybiopsis luxurians FD-317 M1]
MGVSKAEDTFNPTLAQAVGDQPESTAVAPATTPTTPSITSSPSPTSKKSDAGVIAGSVVGGVIAGCIIVVAVLYLLRRQRHRRRRNRSHIVELDDKPRPYPIPGIPESRTSHTGTAFHASVPVSSVPSAGPRLYNPNDPTTFPNAVLSMAPSHSTTRPAQSASGHSPQSSETGMTGFISSNYHTLVPNRQPASGIIPEL